jgi:hypothetical protein
MEDPTEEELAGDAEKLETMVAQLQHIPDFSSLQLASTLFWSCDCRPNLQ